MLRFAAQRCQEARHDCVLLRGVLRRESHGRIRFARGRIPEPVRPLERNAVPVGKEPQDIRVERDTVSDGASGCGSNLVQLAFRKLQSVRVVSTLTAVGFCRNSQF